VTDAHDYLRALLDNLRAARRDAGLSEGELEENLILGPGWISRFESGETPPSIDVVLAILREIGASMDVLLEGLPEPRTAVIDRNILAEQSGNDVVINFRYAKFNAHYVLPDTTIGAYEDVIKTLRDGLARLAEADQSQNESIKTDSVARTFLYATQRWPHANPSDLWWFLVYRAYCDPYNHPAQYARLDFSQSWKRTGGWALEEILVRHYTDFLKQNGVNMFIATAADKRRLVEAMSLDDRIEADKIDVVLTGDTPGGPVFFGVVHVKASFAERRTDDVPMSLAPNRAGYTSPLWTMDCKSTPGEQPVNRGELGRAQGNRSAKRKDIEDEGYFTGCFSYNRLTQPSSQTLPPDRRIYLCDFSSPNDVFSQFILQRWEDFRPG